MGTRFEALRDAFFDRYVALEPEEATTLGLHHGDHRLRAMDAGALADRARFFRDTLDALDALDATSLSRDEALDRDAMTSLCRWELRAHDELRLHERSVEWSLYPYAMISYGRAQGLDMRARAAQVARYLREHERNLARGASRGEAPHASLVRYVVEQQLPEAARDLAELSPEAARAYEEHGRFLRERVLPAAPETRTLGRDEYRRRLRDVLALDDDLDALTETARAQLTEAQSWVLSAARSLDEGRHVRTLDEAMALVRAMQSERLRDASEIVPGYRAVMRRAAAFVRERALMALPDDLEPAMEPYPAGMCALGAGTNWPAPLLDATRAGQFVVHPDPAAHVVAWRAVGAVHEGVPGHFLQSAAWRERYGASRAPVRFLCVADDVAFARGFLRPMVMVEGWAIYVEELLRARGFHAGRDALFAAVSHCVRAARVLADAGLHAGAMSRDDAARLLTGEAGMTDASARGEVERYLRLPLQAVTYLMGRLEIERLRDRSAPNDLAAFHARLLDAGPVPPRLLG